MTVLELTFLKKIVFIHPFLNGNGRHARFMADLILEKIFAIEVFSWGGASLANHNQIRGKYIKVLKIADEHDYSLLLEFVRSVGYGENSKIGNKCGLKEQSQSGKMIRDLDL